MEAKENVPLLPCEDVRHWQKFESVFLQYERFPFHLDKIERLVRVV